MTDHHDDDFVKNYEDQDSSGDFEAKVNETISAHIKQTVNRPVSKSGRPESSRYNAQNWKTGNNGNQNQVNNQREQQDYQNNNRENGRNQYQDQVNESEQQQPQNKNKQIYEALKKQTSQQLPNPVIQKMSKFIAFHHISLESFWKSSRIYVELDEFIGYCLEIGMAIQEWELETVQKELTDQDGLVTIKILCDKIQPWHNQENAMLEFIREKVLSMATSSKKKFRVQSQKNARQQSAKSGSYNQRPQSGNSQEKQFNEFKFHENNSKIYLSKHKQKEKDQDKLLNMTISKNQNEHEYEALIKMGEANEIEEELNRRTNFRAYKDSDGHMKVHVYEGERFQSQMTLVEFKREYNSLKLAYNESKNLKIWDVLSENKKAIKGRDFSKNIQKNESVVIEQVDGEPTGKKVKVTRQSELKKVLLETMWLSNILNEQSNILNKKGINVNNQLNKSYNTLNVNRSMNASHQS